MDKIKDKKILYMSIIVAIILVIIGCIVSITYSFYTTTKSENSTISGSAAGSDLSGEGGEEDEALLIERISTDANDGLVPQLSDTTYLSQAVTGTDGKKCVDANGNTVCQIYKITFNNNFGYNINTGATLSLIGETTDLKWELMASSSALNNPRVTHDASDKNMETNLNIKDGESKDYYLLIWFEETGEAQTKLSTDSFSGIITFEGSSGTVSILLNDSVYKRVSYLQSSGTQYINTGVKPDDKTVMQMKFINLENTGYSIIGYYGTDSEGKESDLFRFFNASGVAYLDYGSGSNYNRISGSNISANTLYELEVGNRYVKDLTTDTDLLTDDEVSFSEKNYDIYVNGNNNYSKNKWYYLKIFKNNILVRNYIPVYRVSDNKPGLFDLVNEVFYTNNGTGEFTVGNE